MIELLCETVTLNDALWGSIKTKLREVLNCDKYYFLHILMQNWLLWYSYQKLQNADCHTYMISFKTILQRFGLSEIVIYAYFYGPIKK